MLETGHILSQKYFEIFHYLRMVLWNSIFRCRLFSGIVLNQTGLLTRCSFQRATLYTNQMERFVTEVIFNAVTRFKLC